MNIKFPHTDEIKFILRDKADFVILDGLNYLIPNWKRFAEKYADTEDLIYEWLNDLATREIIDQVLNILSDEERAKIEKVIDPIDKIVFDKTFEIMECVWGPFVEKDKMYNREKHWYFYRVNQDIFDSEEGQFTKRI
ncbi:MAG TPA: hypothetical protein VF691_13595 [Cytophagaceae bacterium]|jgi:hypothetical protein